MNRSFWKPLSPGFLAKGRRFPKVSVLIAARNEARNIERCLEGLYRQTYRPLEIWVGDDRSTDDTAKRVLRFQRRARGGPAVHLLHGRPLPSGWRGKPWICHQLAKKAEGEWLLFVDADTWHAPETVARLYRTAREMRYDALTAVAYQVCGTLLEKLVIPAMAFSLLAFLPLKWVYGRNAFFSRFAGFSGQLIFIRKEVYEKSAGHAAVKSEIIEDLALGRRVVQAGFSIGAFNGGDAVFCRMYRSAREVVEGFSKNIFPLFGFSTLLFSAVQVLGLVLFAVPWGMLFAAPVLSFPWLSALFWITAQAFAMGGIVFTFSLPKAALWTHPLGVLLFSGIGWNSWRWFRTKKARWKGRPLAVEKGTKSV